MRLVSLRGAALVIKQAYVSRHVPVRDPIYLPPTRLCGMIELCRTGAR